MISSRIFYSFAIVILLAMSTHAQSNTRTTDRLGIKGPIHFDNSAYYLNWSSHPSANYFKQEYIPKGENVNMFKSMVMVEAATGDILLKNVVEAKITELKTLSQSNPFISYENFYNGETGEYILDFIITQNSADGKSAIIAERNVYRYKNLSSGKGIMLFAVSTRSYGADTKNFLVAVKSDRKKLVDKVRAYKLPAVTVN